MSHGATSAPTPQGSEAGLLEKIRLAEKESSARLESAKKEAEGIVAKAREQANALLQQAEETARIKKEEIFAEGREAIDAEIESIHAETEKQVQDLRQRTEESKDLQQVVLSILQK